MLDQNTDRMWYVIGAVIVGAAIIFLVNSSFPQLFASVGDTFKDKVEDTSVVITEMTPTDGINLLAGTSYDISSWKTSNVNQHYGSYVQYIDIPAMGLVPGETITVSGEYDLGRYSLSHRYMFSHAGVSSDMTNAEKINFHTSDRYTGVGSFSHTVKIPEDRRYLTLMFNNGNYNGQGTDFIIKTQRIKLERGSTATPY